MKRENTWAQEYYDALEFFYWEPQHLGRKKNPETTLIGVVAVRNHLRKMEVSFNHLLNMFFSLAPSEFRNRLFGHLFGTQLEGSFTFHGRGIESRYGIEIQTQPDLYFTSERAVVSIELKIGAKSSLTQVLKYLSLGLAEEIDTRTRKNHFLALMAPGMFKTLWKESYRDVRELTGALQEADIARFLGKHAAGLKGHADRLREMCSELTISYMPYGAFAGVLKDQLGPAGTGEGGNEVYRNLLQGMLGELAARGYHVASAVEE